MTTLSELTRAVHRDAVAKQRLYSAVAPHVGAFAFDAEVEEMTAREFAAKCLKKLGLRAADDPVAALEAWLAGKKEAADLAVGRKPSHAQDSSGDSFMDRYLA